MAGYRGDGYGQYGNVGDDDYRFGEDQAPRHGAAQGNLMGGAEGTVRGFFDRDGEAGEREGRLADDPRAVQAAEEYRRRYGREGYEGSYAQHDEPYRSYRERHIQQMDQEYAEYCRENGHEFSSAFENWRSGRRGGGGVATMSAAGGSPEAGSAGGMSGASAGLLADESSGTELGSKPSSGRPSGGGRGR